MEAESDSRDLLQRFAGISTVSGDPRPSVASELSLGLSLGGSFSSNPREKASLLIRSASISSFPNLISSTVKGDYDDDNKKDITNLQGGTTTQLKRTCSMPVPGAEDYRKKKVLQTLKRLEAKRKRHEKRISGGGGGGGLPPLSQGSGGSSSSSGGLPMQGFESTSKKLERRVSGTSDLEMPCVSTRGSGPDGKRIEGFLYRYSKGEEVRIVCVCHGNFFTPAEFVRHAGGGDVDHPMKHIVVNTPPSPFL